MFNISRPKMTPSAVLAAALFLFALIASIAWVATALSFHLTGATLIAAYGTLGLGALITCAAMLNSKRWGWAALGLVLGAGLGWYQTLTPQEHRDWAFDVAHGVEARQDGNIVEMINVRNFNWTSVKTANVSWEARRFDLDKLSSVDLVTSVWDSPDIAHVIVTFGFSDGQRVAFSVETRREAHERFNTVGGFFREFELVLIAATEEDILKLRTNHRREDVKLYPLALNAQQRRHLFLTYVDLANDLEAAPAFYNTLTHNCTTTLYPLANAVHPDLKLDWRLMMSGHLPSYIEELGGLKTGAVDEARAAITKRALAAKNVDYSVAIREGYEAE
ncbi:MAG: DUF4105 domain-containing protein [Pseudomonadota bacterium]